MEQETKDKIKRARTGKKHLPETKRRMSESHTGKKHTEETRKKISETMKRKGRVCKIFDPWSPI
jgi:hypothetical protein